MANSKVIKTVEEALSEFLEDNGLALWDVEFLKEGKDWFLRVYIDKAEGADSAEDENGWSEAYVSTDDCELVSRYLSEKLDELDPIQQNYYLEVSSPGLDRTLTKPEHFARYKGEQVDLRLYKAIDGAKDFTGTLLDYNPETGEVMVDAGKNAEPMVFKKEELAKVQLAVIF